MFCRAGGRRLGWSENGDLGSTAGGGLDDHTATHQLESLANAEQSEARGIDFFVRRIYGNESGALVRNGQSDFTAGGDR